MMLRFFQVDAFTDRPFGGNPAGVCPLDAWLPDEVMQAIAAENNLSETAFFAPARDGDVDYDLRWFTPTVEMDLCGHATLASAYVLAEHLGDTRDVVRFSTMSVPLAVAREGDRFVLDFPTMQAEPVTDAAPYIAALGAPPREVHRAGGFALAVYEAQFALEAAFPALHDAADLADFDIYHATHKVGDEDTQNTETHADIPNE